METDNVKVIHSACIPPEIKLTQKTFIFNKKFERMVLQEVGLPLAFVQRLPGE
jgi:hypothetical protein